MIFECFETMAKIYASCAYRKDGRSFANALCAQDELLALVEGEGVQQAYLRKVLPIFCASQAREHLLAALEYEMHIALKRTNDEDEIRVLVLTRAMLNGLDLQRKSETPIPLFITALAAFELDRKQIERILYLVSGSPPEGSYAFIGKD